MNRQASRPARDSLLAALPLLLACLLPPSAALAQAPAGGLLRWRGTVEREVVLEVRGDRITRVGRDAGDARSDRVEASAPLPRETCLVYARGIRGRALVSVDEQPSRANGYTASVLVYNERGSPEDIELELVWLYEDSLVIDAGSGYGYGAATPPPREPDPVPTWSVRDGFGADSGGGYRHGGSSGGYRAGSERGGKVDWLRFTGMVDGVDYIEIRGGDVSVRHVKHLPIQSMDYKLSAPLPERDLRLELIKVEGRGDIRLVGEPSAANNWTASVLLDDGDKRGASRYSFEVRWERPRDIRLGGTGRPLATLSWSGWVDDDDVLVVRGQDIAIEHRSGRPVRGDKAVFSAPLPSRAVQVSVEKLEGRGRVAILEQPTAANDFQLKVHIDDPKGGDDFYRIELKWEP